jgi:hypothetical protein
MHAGRGVKRKPGDQRASSISHGVVTILSHHLVPLLTTRYSCNQNVTRPTPILPRIGNFKVYKRRLQYSNRNIGVHVRFRS